MSKALGFVFPGQGSQYHGMLNEYFLNSDTFCNVFEQAKDISGIDFKSLIQDGSADDLSPTEITQPLLLTSNYALWMLCDKNPEDIEVMAGHSLGEYCAYVAAGSITFEEALNLVMLRAKYMQEAVKEGEGGIAAILGLTKEELDPICKAVSMKGALVSMANLNSDKQIVISGTKAGVENAIVLSKEKGAKRAIPLAMSVPSHCELMKPASEKFSEELKKINFKVPKTTILQNYSVTHSDDVDVIKNNLISQIHSPVRWDETMNKFQEKNLESLYECGPSKVLTGLVKRKFIDTKVYALDDYETLKIIQGA